MCKVPVKLSLPANQHPVFLHAGCPSCRPNHQCRSNEGKVSHSMYLTTQAHLGYPTLSLTTKKAPSYLWEVAKLSSALWPQYDQIFCQIFCQTVGINQLINKKMLNLKYLLQVCDTQMPACIWTSKTVKNANVYKHRRLSQISHRSMPSKLLHLQNITIKYCCCCCYPTIFINTITTTITTTTSSLFLFNWPIVTEISPG